MTLHVGLFIYKLRPTKHAVISKRSAYPAIRVNNGGSNGITKRTNDHCQRFE
nr:MAG TPA: hypothetical protein [Caudoviricetes sp.]